MGNLDLERPLADTLAELKRSLAILTRRIQRAREKQALARGDENHWSKFMEDINAEIYGIVSKGEETIKKTKGDKQCQCK